ncbi:hypothetical protein, partial [Thermoleptolyngbya sp.]
STKRSKIAPNMVRLPLMHRFAVPILAELDLDVSHLERAGAGTYGAIALQSAPSTIKWDADLAVFPYCLSEYHASEAALSAK